MDCEESLADIQMADFDAVVLKAVGSVRHVVALISHIFDVFLCLVLVHGLYVLTKCYSFLVLLRLLRPDAAVLWRVSVKKEDSLPVSGCCWEAAPFRKLVFLFLIRP